MKPLDKLSPTNILIIKPSAIGDVVHTLPILKLLREKFSTAKISWLITPLCAGLLEGHPLLDEVILFERGRFGRGWRSPDSARGLASFVSQLRDRKFDLVIDLQGLFRSGWLAWHTRAPVRIGFENAREFAWLFYTHRLPTGSPQQHAIERYLKLIETLGCATSPVEFPFHVTHEDREKVSQLLGDDAPFAVLLPGTNWQTKRWPVENFGALVEPLREKFELKTIVAGSAADVDLARSIGGVDFTGKTTLRELVALLDRATVVIANDSGPMHIAAGLGRPLVTMFGPTNPVRTGPYSREDCVVRIDIPCSPCYSRTCSHQSCLRWLSVDAVMRMVEAQLAHSDARAKARG